MFLSQGRVTKDQVDRIYQFIKENPGLGIKEISEKTSIGFVAVRVGVDYLVETKKAKKRSDANRCVHIFTIEE